MLVTNRFHIKNEKYNNSNMLDLVRDLSGPYPPLDHPL